MDFTFDDGLTPEQESAIAALLTQPTLAKAAKSADVSDRTLRRWLREPVFRDAFRSARRQMFAQAIALTQHYTPLAVNVLAKVMTDPLSASPSKVAAAAAMMRFGRESIELDDLVERIEKLEEGQQGDGKREGEPWRG
ncbi:MAG: hypothetical protein IT438_15035 [Phycisphaerales bacterium]|nr:hypothetical protein [Phycisphaerales bacterium]